MSSHLLLLFLREDFLTEIEHRQRARQTSGLARSDNREIPATPSLASGPYPITFKTPRGYNSPPTNRPDHPEPARNIQQLLDVRQVSRASQTGRGGGEVGGSDEGEEHDEAEEDEHEEDVDAKGTDHEGEGDERPVVHLLALVLVPSRACYVCCTPATPAARWGGRYGGLHRNVMPSLRRVPRRARSTTFRLEASEEVVSWILGVGETAPVAAVDDEDGHWECYVARYRQLASSWDGDGI